jgi:hypothetical protein
VRSIADDVTVISAGEICERGLAATCELMFLHVSDGRVTPMPPAAVRAVTALAAVQAAVPRPGQAGRRVAIPGRTRLTRRGCG